MERVENPFMRRVFDDDYVYTRPSPSMKQDIKNDEELTMDVVRIRRISDNGQTTMGRLYLNGKFMCHTLEDTRRLYELSPHDPDYEAKVPGKTCILAGEFSLIERRFGGFFNKYIERFSHINHEGMIEIKDVLEFTDVLLHCGNTHRDTAGCILLGTKRNDDFIAASGKTYERVYPAIYDMIKYSRVKLVIEDV